jgi:hypothetical protein
VCLSSVRIQRGQSNVWPRDRTLSAAQRQLLLGRIKVLEAQRCYALEKRPSGCAWATQWIGCAGGQAHVTLYKCEMPGLPQKIKNKCQRCFRIHDELKGM